MHIPLPLHPRIKYGAGSALSPKVGGEVYPPQAAPIRRIPDPFGKATRGWGQRTIAYIHNDISA
jgi:hypothetical protein